jgi:hypothetical protein
MINLHISQHKKEFDIELYGADGLILNELSTAALRVLDAMERCNGHQAKENLTTLILMLIEKSEENGNVRHKRE